MLTLARIQGRTQRTQRSHRRFLAPAALLGLIRDLSFLSIHYVSFLPFRPSFPPFYFSFIFSPFKNALFSLGTSRLCSVSVHSQDGTRTQKKANGPNTREGKACSKCCPGSVESRCREYLADLCAVRGAGDAVRGTK